MKLPQKLTHEFVEFIPDLIDDGTIYVSIDYATAVHKCCCGCGREVVTPLSPTDWKLTFDGKSISLDPSIGNWGFSCRSHYWVRNNQAIWADSWSQARVEASRSYDRRTKSKYYGTDKEEAALEIEPDSEEAAPSKKAWWRNLLPW